MGETHTSAKSNKENPMREIAVDKVTVNIGVGSSGERLDFAKDLLARLTGKKPVVTAAKKRDPVFKLRKGMEIGTKITLRGKDAATFVDKALGSRKNRKILEGNFDNRGNFSFGVAEYIDFPGAKYDPDIGMMGFDVSINLKRKGKRVNTRRIRTSKIGKSHFITKAEAIEFAKSVLKATVDSE